jgi:hypothetical protein
MRTRAVELPSADLSPLRSVSAEVENSVNLRTMLRATPAVSVELERRSWVYLAVRPNGSTAVLIGKYLAAVT